MPIEVVAVVDRSGSMDGAKMQSMQQTLKFLVSAGLSSKDRLAIVTFDHRVDTVLELTKMDAQGRNEALASIEGLRTGGATNLSGGLLKGIDVLAQGSDIATNCTRAVLLFTDGIANHGILERDALVSAAQNVMSDRPIPLFTFGFGAQHEENTLRSLAESTSGLYYFIAGTEDIPRAFADCLGGLVSVVAQNAELVLEASSGAAHIALVHGKYAVKMEEEGQRVIVKLGDVYSEDEKDILVQLELPVLPQPMDTEAMQPTLTASCRFFSVSASAMQEVRTTIVIQRPRTVAVQAPINYELDQQRQRVHVAEAMDRAAQLADAGDLSAGREAIRSAVADARASPSASSELVQGLIEDLERVAEGYASRELYTTSGSKVSKMSAMSHQLQRSNHMTGGAYEKMGKRAMKRQMSAPP